VGAELVLRNKWLPHSRWQHDGV